MTMKRMTKNREAILKILSDSNIYHEPPPYEASSIQLELEMNFKHYGLKQKVAIGQIHRTLRDLVSEGLVTFENRIVPYGMNCLPKRVRFYYLVGHENRVLLLQEFFQAMRTANKANGDYFFGKLTEAPWPDLKRIEYTESLGDLGRRLQEEGNMERQLELLSKATYFVLGISKDFEF